MEAAAIENNNDNDISNNDENKAKGEVHSLGYLIIFRTFRVQAKRYLSGCISNIFFTKLVNCQILYNCF